MFCSERAMEKVRWGGTPHRRALEGTFNLGDRTHQKVESCSEWKLLIHLA